MELRRANDSRRNRFSDVKAQSLKKNEADGAYWSPTEIQESTDWKAVTIAGIVTFLSVVQQMLATFSQWPYMHTIDPEATSRFYGITTSASRFGHAIFTVVFALWAYKHQTTKTPLVFGRLIAFLSCCLYLSVELLTVRRRYLMLLCSFLLGTASSSLTILRAYFAAVSTTQDRTKAYSVFAVANMLPILVVPVCQMIFATMRYPGFVLIEKFLKFHIYSGPIWIATVINFAAIVIIHYGLEDVKSTKTSNEMDNSLNLGNIMDLISRVVSLDFSWPLIILCWSERMLISLNIVTLNTISAPFVMIAYGYDGQQTVHIFSLCMGAIGVLAIIVSVAFIFFKFGNIISPRWTFLIAVSMTVTLNFGNWLRYATVLMV
ncbi:hypothetical protein KIN20_011099 [Parelaphostrongylus tenuis]|uniref:Uncharacterized protein n=1 Tax=Parelaphostrongylus tenuis TaxID=148309 RepID=A0AAD5MZU7_PARTN|nr:hypothetical protein KIN20_011099 [Parelaphostrongylus tenuis]